MRGSSFEAAEGAGRWKDAGRKRRKISRFWLKLFCYGRGIMGGALNGRRYLRAASALLSFASRRSPGP